MNGLRTGDPLNNDKFWLFGNDDTFYLTMTNLKTTYLIGIHSLSRDVNLTASFVNNSHKWSLYHEIFWCDFFDVDVRERIRETVVVFTVNAKYSIDELDFVLVNMQNESLQATNRRHRSGVAFSVSHIQFNRCALIVGIWYWLLEKNKEKQRWNIEKCRIYTDKILFSPFDLVPWFLFAAEGFLIQISSIYLWYNKVFGGMYWNGPDTEHPRNKLAK